MDKSVLWIVATVVVAMTCLSLLMLGGGAEATFDDWMKLLRTAATVAGFGLATLAYTKWRRPDDAKRRADTAQAIIRHSAKLEGALTQAHIGLIASVPDTSKVGLDAKVKAGASKLLPVESVPDLLKALTELRGYRAEVNVLFKERRIGEDLDWVDERGNKVATALRALGSLREQGDALKKFGKADTAYDRIFEDLNVRFVNEVDFPGPDVEDLWRTELSERCDSIRATLAKYLVGNQ